jgi:hypothetical protein
MRRFSSAIAALLVALLIVPMSADQAIGETVPSETPWAHFTSREAELTYWLDRFLLDPEWIRVAKLESGAQLNSNVALQAHNYFGLHRAYSRTTTAEGHFGLYACYPSIEACARDVAYWAQMSPRRAGEPFDKWLRRRGWNHLPHYYRTLAQVRLPKATMSRG